MKKGFRIQDPNNVVPLDLRALCGENFFDARRPCGRLFDWRGREVVAECHTPANDDQRALRGWRG
jgi:hypothetical protein